MKRDWKEAPHEAPHEASELPLRSNPAGAYWAPLPGPQYDEEGNRVTKRRDKIGHMVCSLCGRPLPGWKSPIYEDGQVGAWGRRGRPIEQHPECGELWRAMNRFEEAFPQIEFAESPAGLEGIKRMAQWFWSHRNYLNADTARVKRAVREQGE